MKLQQVVFRNFRNIKESHFSPNKTLNFLVGSNGQGKTSFIEAIGFLSTLRSFREAPLSSVIRWGADSSEISCTLTTEAPETGHWETQLRLIFQASDSLRQKVTKTAYVNQKAFRSSTQYLCQKFGSSRMGFHTVVFNPSDHDLVRGEPLKRRSFLDQTIGAEEIDYLRTLQKYNRALQQRNSLLKCSDNITSKILSEFTEPLCQFGTQLTLKRLQWLQKLAIPLNYALHRIAPDLPDLRIVYLSNWLPQLDNLCFNNNKLQPIHFTGQGHLPSLELVEQSFRAKVAALETTEKRAGHSLVGPHRDDWAFFLGDQGLKGHGSQGEVRSSLLALKLSEIELFRNEAGYRPVFLLDDFSSELDRARRLFLMEYLMETDLQTFVTTTEDTSFMGKRFWVSNGTVKEGSA